MKINWKVRLKNPHFIVQVIASFLMPIFAYKGISGSEVETWSMLIGLIAEAMGNPFVFATIALSVYNALIDNTTPGLSDSQRALQYGSVKDSIKSEG